MKDWHGLFFWFCFIAVLLYDFSFCTGPLSADANPSQPNGLLIPISLSIKMNIL